MDDSYWSGTSHVRAYSSRELTVRVDPEEPTTDSDRVKLYAGLSEFPRGRVVGETVGSAFDRSRGTQDRTLSVDSSDAETGKKYHYFVGLAPADSTADDLNYSELTTVMETDPFEFYAGGSRIRRAEYEGQLDDDSGRNYSRNSVEGAYELEITGRTAGTGWTVGFFAYKSAHADATAKSRGRSRSEYVSYELTDGTGAELASLLKEEGESLGYSGHELVEFVIDFVQSLPYVPDDVSRGFDDYTKFIMETMPEMGGDCEDTAIMLASILQAEPFNYDMVLIQPPGHMAAGLWQSNPSGYYWELDGRKYSYIETTGQGWGIGDVPEEYEGSRAYVHQV